MCEKKRVVRNGQHATFFVFFRPSVWWNLPPRGGENGILWWCFAPTGVWFCCLGQVGNVATAIAHKTALACATWANVLFALGANAVVFLVDLVLAIFAIHGLLLFVNC